MKTRYYQNGLDITTTVYNAISQQWEDKPSIQESERFHPVIARYESLSIADSLEAEYGHSKVLLNEMAKGLAIAEIGGYYFFSDGSETPDLSIN